ncbi:MAG: Xaa-Pro peptidase family protein [Planctomycetota bacterium]
MPAGRPLFFEDWSAFEPGHLRRDNTARGEYMCRTVADNPGGWYRPSAAGWNAPSFGRTAAPWAVERLGRTRTVVQKGRVTADIMCLTRGDEPWRDYTVTATVWPGGDELAGLMGRYRTSRDFYAAGWEHGMLKLVKRLEGARTVISQIPAPRPKRARLALVFRCIRISVNVDGRRVITAEDGSLPSGGIGLLALAPARFGPVKVTGKQPPAGPIPTIPITRSTFPCRPGRGKTGPAVPKGASMSRRRAFVIIADSEHSSDMLYASGFRAPDPFILISVRGRTYLIVNSMEYARARKEAAADEVVNMAAVRVRGPKRTLGHIFVTYARRFGVRTYEVPSDFPLGAADTIRRLGIRLKPMPAPFFPERMVKTPAEIRAMGRALRATEAAFRTVAQTLAAARIGRDRGLRWQGAPLTSERVRNVVQLTLAGRGMAVSDIIIAGGDQGCDPHCAGRGRLRAGETIIVDIFPRSTATGYWGDLTRTYLKGRPTAAQRRLYRTVQQAQALAIRMIGPRVAARTVHAAVDRFFKRRGYKTETVNGVAQGFIHSTGHGLGLDIHEPPGVAGNSKHVFRAGNVVTVEPGLYYPGVGAVRIEDDVVVTARGCRVLSRLPRRFVIP